MKKKQPPSMFMFILLLISFVSFAAIPQHIAYQGVITDTAGNPRPDGSYSFTFSIYHAEIGDTALWKKN